VGGAEVEGADGGVKGDLPAGELVKNMDKKVPKAAKPKPAAKPVATK